MKRRPVPDLLISHNMVDTSFESSSNLVFAKKTKDGSRLYFTNRGFIKIGGSITKLFTHLLNDSFLRIGDELIVRRSSLKEIIYEDYQYYLFLEDVGRILISQKQVDLVKSSLRRIAS